MKILTFQDYRVLNYVRENGEFISKINREWVEEKAGCVAVDKLTELLNSKAGTQVKSPVFGINQISLNVDMINNLREIPKFIATCPGMLDAITGVSLMNSTNVLLTLDVPEEYVIKYRKTYIYARVSTSKQKRDLENQIDMLKQFCFSNGYCISKVFSDIASGISFEKRKEFFIMLDDIINGKVERVVITYKDRLSRVGFELFFHLFKKYHCEIVVMSEVGSQKLDSEEIFEEIVSLLHCYSMKLYSKRKVSRLKQVLEENE